MKGNETRVVFYLNPVDQVTGSKVAKVKPISTGMFLLFLFVLLLGGGALLYLILGNEQRQDLEEKQTLDSTEETRSGVAKSNENNRSMTTKGTKENENSESKDDNSESLTGLLRGTVMGSTGVAMCRRAKSCGGGK